MSNWQKKCVKEKICFVEQQKILIFLFFLSLFLSPFSLFSFAVSLHSPFLCSFCSFVSLLLKLSLFFPSFCLFVVKELSSSSKSTWEDSCRFAQCLRKWWSRFFLFFLSFCIFLLESFTRVFLNVYWLPCLIVNMHLNNLKITIIVFLKYLKLN